MSFAKLAFGVWLVVMVIGGAGLLAKHVAAMPTPHVDGPALATLRTPEERGRWLAVHVLYADCRCSQRVADHLAARAPADGWSEIVLWIGDTAPPELAKYDVRVVTVADAARYAIEAAPSMIVLDPRDRVLYAGGYTSIKQGPVIEDLRVMQRAHAGAPVAPLPLFGCAVSARLKQANPLPAP